MNKHHELLIKQAKGLLETESDSIANAANLCSLLYFNIERVNWLGFYFQRGQELVLGPFHGQPACTRIKLGAGVCGTAFLKGESLLVDDVHSFDGHIACDVASESELVVPFKHSRIAGVLDIDSPEKARFSPQDKFFFEQVVALYIETIDV